MELVVAIACVAAFVAVAVLFLRYRRASAQKDAEGVAAWRDFAGQRGLAVEGTTLTVSVFARSMRLQGRIDACAVRVRLVSKGYQGNRATWVELTVEPDAGFIRGLRIKRNRFAPVKKYDEYFVHEPELGERLAVGCDDVAEFVRHLDADATEVLDALVLLDGAQLSVKGQRMTYRTVDLPYSTDDLDFFVETLVGLALALGPSAGRELIEKWAATLREEGDDEDEGEE